jgi:formylglycine-generating enzyme required for sulfatase activity
MPTRNDNQPPLPDPGLIFVEGGTFTMGDNNGGYNDEKPEHPVKVSSFYIGKFQVTQQLWEAVMKNNPSNFKGKRRPVEKVSWDDARDFITKLNDIGEVQHFLRQLDPPGETFRLPAEAEWEYAARGGIYSVGYRYAGSDELRQVGWYEENSGGETHEVGMLRPNELGLHDMSGNVWEWCEDDWHGNYNGAPEDGAAWIDSPARGVYRVDRGGGYFYDPSFCRSTTRYDHSPSRRYDYLGLRLAVSLQSVG